jgi:hypothetical protein
MKTRRLSQLLLGVAALALAALACEPQDPPTPYVIVVPAPPTMPSTPTFWYREPTAKPGYQPTFQGPVAIATQGFGSTPATPTPFRPTQPPNGEAVGATSFQVTLSSGEWHKFVLGPAAQRGAYQVGLAPLAPSTDGAYIEYTVLPEYDGEQWNDVLALRQPVTAAPLPVQVSVYGTADWPVVFHETLDLTPGDWQGYILQAAAQKAGYAVEINPLEPGERGATLERVVVQPEYSNETWWDVLRVQNGAGQARLKAEVIVYRTPAELPLRLEVNLHIQPGDWQGYGLGPTTPGTIYLVEITPTADYGSHIERYVVQPEFDGVQWNAVVRLLMTEDRPAMDVAVRVYQVGP